jgi:DNA-binding PadR family transcriptional regulator
MRHGKHHRGGHGPGSKCGPPGGDDDFGHGPGYHQGRHREHRHGWSRRGFDGDGFGETRRHRRSASGRGVLSSDELRLILLGLIAETPRHGYDLIRAIEDLTGGEYAPSPGVVYPALSVLQDMGMIEEAPSEGARKIFSVTGQGTAELQENADAAAALSDRLKGLAGPAGGRDIAPIRRAMDNLKTALRTRLHAEDISKDTVYDIAAIIDETAQRIERL